MAERRARLARKIHRRDVLRALLATPFAIAGCSGGGDGGVAEAVLYTSIDDFLWFELKSLFERESGIRVRRAGDTEATKTFGLMQRLLDERERPRADVWWSSEILSTVRLAREGVLAPFTTVHEKDFEGGWPESLRGDQRLWHGFAQRARVIAYNPGLVPPDEAPRSLADLTQPRWNGRVVIADPRFGTTRTHVAAIARSDGPAALHVWLTSLKLNNARVLSGNSTCAREVADAKADVCLCDTDDVWALQAQARDIDFVYEDDVGLTPAAAVQGRGPLVIPNTAAIVKGGPNPEAGRALLDFILSAEVERRIALSDSRNVPIRPSLAAEFPEIMIPNPWTPDWPEVQDIADEALQVAQDVLNL